MHHYYHFYKPVGCVSARKDAEHTTVMDYFPSELRETLFPLGRLDKNTEGLLLITDDGKLIDINDDTKTYNVVTNEYCATLSYTDPSTHEVTESVFKGLTPVVPADEAPVDNVSMIAALQARRDSTGPSAKVDTTVRLKVDTGEAAAYAKPINRFMRDVKVVYFDVLSQMGLTKK